MGAMLRPVVGTALALGIVASGCESRTPPKIGLGVGLGLLAVGGLLAAGRTTLRSSWSPAAS
jgi:hypothetical protein